VAYPTTEKMQTLNLILSDFDKTVRSGHLLKAQSEWKKVFYTKSAYKITWKTLLKTFLTKTFNTKFS